MDNTFIKCLKWANDYGIWDLIQTLIIIATFMFGLKLVLFPKKRIRNLNFFTQMKRGHPQYPLIIYIEIRNYTGRTVIISNPFFEYKTLRPDPNARGDLPTSEYEVKFPGPSGLELSEVEVMLRNKEHVQTYVVLDPTHTDSEVQYALRNRKVGSFRCTCTWLGDKPVTHKLVRSI